MAIYAYLISAAYVASRMVLPALAAAFAQSHTGSFILSRLAALSMISLCGWLIYASLYLAVNPLIFFPLIFLPQLSASIFAYTQYTGDIIMGHEAVKNMNHHRKRSAQNYINEKMYYLLNAMSSQTFPMWMNYDLLLSL